MVPGAYSVGTQRAFQGCDRRKREGPGGLRASWEGAYVGEGAAGQGRGAGLRHEAMPTRHPHGGILVSGAASNGRIALRHSHAH